jgi:hypothetical protein
MQKSSFLMPAKFATPNFTILSIYFRLRTFKLSQRLSFADIVILIYFFYSFNEFVEGHFCQFKRKSRSQHSYVRLYPCLHFIHKSQFQCCVEVVLAVVTVTDSQSVEVLRIRFGRRVTKRKYFIPCEE